MAAPLWNLKYSNAIVARIIAKAYGGVTKRNGSPLAIPGDGRSVSVCPGVILSPAIQEGANADRRLAATMP
jgi:hypothetical protein